MNKIDIYNRDYEIFKTHYEGLNGLRVAINGEIADLATEGNSTLTIRKLLKLRDVIGEAIKLCGETMYEDIRLMGHELLQMKEDIQV